MRNNDNDDNDIILNEDLYRCAAKSLEGLEIEWADLEKLLPVNTTSITTEFTGIETIFSKLIEKKYDSLKEGLSDKSSAVGILTALMIMSYAHGKDSCYQKRKYG